MMNQVLMIIMAAGAVLGGADRICGNRLGLGEQFEKGFHLLGSMALSMVGMICLAPVLADGLGKLIVPLYRAIGVDPAMFGSFLAIDMGGYQMAKELAADPQMGSYAGLIVAATFGCTLVFTIPVGMGMIHASDRNLFARGIMLGLAAMPLGLVAGGLMCGLPLGVCLWQNIPIFFLSLLLFIGLRRIPHLMVKGFCAAAQGLRCVLTAGLILAAVESLTGWNPLAGMAPIEEALGVVASIGVVMLGSLPIAELLRRALARPMRRIGARLGLNAQSVTGMLIGTVSALPALAAYDQMDRRGKVAVGAFFVSGTGVLASHLGFVVSTEPDMLGALITAKLVGALAAAALAVWILRRDVDAPDEGPTA